MNIKEALDFTREKYDTGNCRITEVRNFLLEHDLEKDVIMNLLGYVYSTNIADRHIIENVENNINYKDVINNPELLQTYEKRNKKEKNNNGVIGLSILIFWVGLVVFLFNFYIAITLFFVATIMFVKAIQKVRDSILKNIGLITLVFIWLIVMAIFQLLVVISN